MPLRRPEQRYHGRQQYVYAQEITERRDGSRPYGRFKDKTRRILHETRLLALNHRYGQRTTIMPYVCCAVLFGYFGTLLGYYQHKKLTEDKWVENYGQDVPMYQAQWWKRTSRYLIARYGVFQRYKLFYFVDEQVIDPLGTDQLSEQKFEIYQHKRLERALRYEEARDDSFDFLQIGEDDIDDFDDFV